MNIYIPYTYLIGWSKHNKWYYGVRYGKNCNPQDLWINYFTSSKVVKKFRTEKGEPDIIQIRKTFNCAKKAKIWEDRVLCKLNVESKDEWLNVRSNTWKNVIFTEEMKKKISNSRLGKSNTKGYTNEYRKENGLKIISGKPKGVKEKQETKNKKSLARIGKVTVKDLSGNCFLVKVDDERLKSGELVIVSKNSRKGKKHNSETINRLKEIAKCREVFTCSACDRSISGKMNWNRHLTSAKHLSHI